MYVRLLRLSVQSLLWLGERKGDSGNALCWTRKVERERKIEKQSEESYSAVSSWVDTLKGTVCALLVLEYILRHILLLVLFGRINI